VCRNRLVDLMLNVLNVAAFSRCRFSEHRPVVNLYLNSLTAAVRYWFSCSTCCALLLNHSSLSFVLSDLLNDLLSWSEEQLQSQLPIEAGAHANVSVNVTGICDFLSHDLLKSSKGENITVFFVVNRV
jgi:hypothetical protein